ncbi:pyrimidine 5'-nucleotidase YjjG [bacterium BMS3Abin02]|nr:pyrimidine 5'-nucleotidase YjjG [bacterium BMS3Abin02]HDL49034.1 HAD family phosphatase [Actinomycetota bacterium]
MAGITTLFFDVGGVLLTNGWDRRSRLHCVESFGLDWEEFRDRHEFVADAFETGRITIDEYLDRTVFYRDRTFSREAFIAGMQAESKPVPGALEFVSGLSDTYLLATLNNESKELNEYRIETFGLHEIFSVFLTSAYLGVKKPDEAIYRLALDITHRRPEESAFIDDRPLNMECARDLGLHTITFENVGQLEAELAALGIN